MAAESDIDDFYNVYPPVAVEEPPPHPTKKAMGNTKVAKSLEIFIRYSENKIHKSKKAQPCPHKLTLYG